MYEYPSGDLLLNIRELVKWSSHKCFIAGSMYDDNPTEDEHQAVE